MNTEIESKLDALLKEPEQALNPSRHEFLLANQTYSQISKYLGTSKKIILPIGSTEQHGPDGILGIDHITATGIAYLVSKVTGVLCMPPLNYGMAMHHLGFPGTIALRPTTYINVIMDVVKSLYRHGFRELIIINGHGGNKAPFTNALAELDDAHAEMDFKFINWWVMPGLEKNIIHKYFAEKEGYHATPTEISVAMALVPDSMVMPVSYKCPQKEVKNENVAWVMPNKFKDYYPDGVMRADHSGSTAAIGLEALRQAVLEIVGII